MEWLGRGLVALETPKGIFLSWRVLGTDDTDIGFHIYRNGVRITSEPFTKSSNYVDAEGGVNDKYRVEAVFKSQATDRSEEVPVWPRKPASHTGLDKKKVPALAYKEIPLDPPPDPVRPAKDTSPAPGGGKQAAEEKTDPADAEEDDAPTSKYVPGDMSVGDLDGDGEYELVFEWEGSPSYLEAITLQGRRLWRISFGPNVTKNHLAFMVYDLDGDGKAEVICKTAPGTQDGAGRYLRTGPAAKADHKAILERKSGRLVQDPSYITVFKGDTGEELATTLYWPQIGPKEDMMKTWGDNYGHRAASVKSCVLYQHQAYPLAVFSRGIYTRIAMGAYQWDGKTLRQAWTFDTEDPKHPEYRAYRGQGNHSLAVGDVDNDGSDEIMYGAFAVDHDGKGMYCTGFGHGDSHALGDLVPDHPGLEFVQGHENKRDGISMRDAATGKILWQVPLKADVGRVWAAEVSAKHRGVVVASSASPNLDCSGKPSETKYNAYAYPIWFDGGVQRALRNRTIIEGRQSGRIFQGWHYNAGNVHASKEDACLVADILGDWREEVIFRRNDNKALLLFSTWIPTERKNYTLMHDPLYRMNIAVQNIGYNQVAHTGFSFPEGAPKANIRYLPGIRGSSSAPLTSASGTPEPAR